MSAPLALLYATVSGNAEALAHAAAEALRVRGRVCDVADVADFPAARLREFDVALLIVSTWGEGAPPPDAEPFFAALDEAALRLDGLRYGVLTLGSSMYPDFCAAGRIVDERLAARGARPLLERRECDTKFKADFQDWLAQVDAALNNPA